METFKVYYEEDNVGFLSSFGPCECNESKANPWLKVDLIFINRLYYIVCVSGMFMRCLGT